MVSVRVDFGGVFISHFNLVFNILGAFTIIPFAPVGYEMIKAI